MSAPAPITRLLLLILIPSIIACSCAYAAPEGEITGVTLDEQGTRVLIQVKGKIGKHTTKVIPEPNRVVVDIEGLKPAKDASKTVPGKGLVHEVRVGVFQGQARVVTDFRGGPVPPFEVRPEKDALSIVFKAPAVAKDEAGDHTGDKSPLAPRAAPATAKPEGTPPVAASPQAVPPRVLEPATSAPARSLTAKPGQGAKDKAAAPGKLAAALSQPAKAGGKPVRSAQDMEGPGGGPDATSDERPPSERPLPPGKTPGDVPETPGANGAPTGPGPQPNRPGGVRDVPPASTPTPLPITNRQPPPGARAQAQPPGAEQSQVSEVRPPVTPPTPDPRLVVQEITELKFVQVGHNSRLIIRGGDHLDYRVVNETPTKMKIDLINAEIPKVHQKPLKTDQWSTSVEMIVPGSQTIFVQLKDAVPNQVHKQKGVLMVDFPPPRMTLTETQMVRNKGTAGLTEAALQGGRAAAEEALAAERRGLQVSEQEDREERVIEVGERIAELKKQDKELEKELNELAKKFRITGDPEVFSKPVTMDFQGIGLRNVFKLLADQAGLNLIMGNEVTNTATVTMRLVQVPLGEVIDQILRTNNLDRDITGNVLWVGNSVKIGESKTARRAEHRQQVDTAQKQRDEVKKEIEKLDTERQTIRKKVNFDQEKADTLHNPVAAETIGAAEQVDLGDGETATLLLVQIKLSYRKPGDMIAVLKCVFNRQCRAYDVSVDDKMATGEQVKSKETVFSSDLEMPTNAADGLAVPWANKLERDARRDARAEERLALLEQLRSEQQASQLERGQLDTRLKKLLVHTLMWAHPKYDVIWIKDTPERIEEMKMLITQLDVPTPQVMVEARVVQAVRNWGRGLGIIWGGRNNQQIQNTGGGPKNSVWGVAGTGFVGAIDRPSMATRCNDSLFCNPLLSGFVNNVITSNTTTGLALQFGQILGQYASDLNVQLNIGEQQGKTKIISRPKIQVAAGEKATIFSGISIPYAQSTDIGTTTIFKTVGLKITVVPLIYPDGRIDMRLYVSDDNIGEISVLGLPTTTVRYADTRLTVKDGETCVIGGIGKGTVIGSHNGWPGLKNVPIVNLFFGASDRSDRREELLFFITPSVMKKLPRPA